MVTDNPQVPEKFILLKLNELLENENLPWIKCVAVTADGVAAMTGNW